MEMKKIKVKINKPVYGISLGLSILEIMSFGIILLNQSINIMHQYNCATWIHIALSFILKLKMFIKTLYMM